ncbi:putative membrane protein YesL [Arthrobacter sp. SLBN-112]|nr:putative membrane protein YesL [Arthrobacter sp. SLBN-112]
MVTERQLVVQKKAEYGAGPLFRAAGTVAGVLTGSALLALANVLLLGALVAAPFTGVWLVLPALVPAGPALVACMYAFNRMLAGNEGQVYQDFIRGYRMNVGQALQVWLPYLLVLGVIAVNLAGSPASLGPTNPAAPALRLAMLVLAFLVATAALNALLLLSRFSFRTRDLYRLSLYSFGARKRASLGNAGILFVTGSLLLMTTAYLLPLLAGAVVFLVCLNSRPLLAHVEEKFTAA